MSNGMVESAVARRRIFWLVFSAMMTSFAVLVFLSMGMSETNFSVTAQQLLAIYVPLLALMAVFYSAEWNANIDSPPTPAERFWPLFVLTATWVFVPPALMLVVVLWQGGSIEQAMRMLNVFAFLGQSVGVVGIALYFAKPRSQNPDPSAPRSHAGLAHSPAN